MNILKGKNDAATQYLKNSTYKQLAIAFKPDIQKSLEDVDAQKAWQDVTTKYNKIPFSKLSWNRNNYTIHIPTE